MASLLPIVKRVVNPFDNSSGISKLVGGIVHGAEQTGAAGIRSVYDIGRGAAASVTGNQVALANTNKAKAVDNPQFLAPITRPFVQIARTIEHPLVSNSFTATNPNAQRIFGTTPVQNIAAGVRSNYAQMHNPLIAGLYGTGQVAQDALALAGVKALGKGGILSPSATKAKLQPPETPGKLPAVPKATGAVPKTITKTLSTRMPSTAIPTRVNAWDVAARPTEDVLRKIDPRLGDMVAQRRDIGERGAATAKASLKITNSLSKEEQTNLARVLKGTEQPLNDKVVGAAAESRRVLKEAYYRAKATGVPVAGYRKNYFPQILNPKTFQEGSHQFNSQVRHLVNSGQAKTEAEAIGMLRRYGNTRKVSPYGNLAKHRTLDLQGYAENVPALHQYLDRAYATIAHTKVMGAGDKTLNKVLNDVRKNGGDVQQAIKSYQQASGLIRGSNHGEAVARALTNIQGSTKLGTSSILNATQPVNTAVKFGIGRAAKTYAQALSKSNRDFLDKTGVADEQVAGEKLFNDQGLRGRAADLLAPGFKQVEQQNRRSAALAGRDYANSLAKKAMAGNRVALQELQDVFGINSIGKKGLTEEQQITAARKAVHDTQFRTGNQDKPGWASTPWGRVLSQFRTYPYKQAQFLKREVINPALKGNLRPAIRLAAVGAPVSIGANALQGKIRGDNYQETAPEKALSILNTVAGGDLVTSTLRNLLPGSSTDSNSYISKAIKAVGGPTVSDATKAVQAGFDATKGKFDTVKRLAVSHVPVVGQSISNRAVPYAAPPLPANNTGTTGTPAQRDANAKKQLATMKKDAGNGSTLVTLDNGKYAYTLDGDPEVHTAASKRLAQQAIAKSSVANSDGSYKVIGDTVYRKAADGTVSTMTKTKFDYTIGTQTLEAQKRGNDLNGWLATANSQLDSIDKQLRDPNIDPLDAITLKNDAEALMADAAKYQSYGGFTKPKAPNKNGYTLAGAKAGSARVAAPKGINVRKLAAPTFKTISLRGYSVKKPTIGYRGKKA